MSDSAEKLARDVQIGALAHAIRLGKRPRPGMVMAGNLSVDEMDDDGTVKVGKKVPVEFEVTQELLDAAAEAINAQRITYREPKTSVMALNNQAVPEAVWNYAKKVQK